jgi:broad specificity phosphatase PhoE
VALVSHGDFFTRLMVAALGIATTSTLWLGMGNTAIARLDYREHDEEVVLVYMNRLTHLPMEMISQTLERSNVRTF